ncbi:helicase [Cystoisospora suis]|uniref:Helicase n=1 Tax=Cystoisospora suis TaxID=483139 RepID=A0A2C6KTI0_9APIC|nr:helicase [Cystoisospora suis]
MRSCLQHRFCQIRLSLQTSSSHSPSPQASFDDESDEEEEEEDSASSSPSLTNSFSLLSLSPVSRMRGRQNLFASLTPHPGLLFTSRDGFFFSPKPLNPPSTSSLSRLPSPCRLFGYLILSLFLLFLFPCDSPSFLVGCDLFYFIFPSTTPSQGLSLRPPPHPPPCSSPSSCLLSPPSSNPSPSQSSLLSPSPSSLYLPSFLSASLLSPSFSSSSPSRSDTPPTSSFTRPHSPTLLKRLKHSSSSSSPSSPSSSFSFHTPSPSSLGISHSLFSPIFFSLSSSTKTLPAFLPHQPLLSPHPHKSSLPSSSSLRQCPLRRRCFSSSFSSSVALHTRHPSHLPFPPTSSPSLRTPSSSSSSSSVSTSSVLHSYYPSSSSPPSSSSSPSSSFFPSTFVSSYSTLHTSASLSSYLIRKKLDYVEHSNKFTLKYCPNCPDHKHRRDNLYKLEVFKNSGNIYCHRCGWKGSFFDLKARLGDLNPQDIVAALHATPLGEGGGIGGGRSSPASPFGCMYTSPPNGGGVDRGNGVHEASSFSSSSFYLHPDVLDDMKYIYGGDYSYTNMNGIASRLYTHNKNNRNASFYQNSSSYSSSGRDHGKSGSQVYIHPKASYRNHQQRPSLSETTSIFRFETFAENLLHAMENRLKHPKEKNLREDQREDKKGVEEIREEEGEVEDKKNKTKKNKKTRNANLSEEDEEQDGCGERVLQYLTKKRGLNPHTLQVYGVGAGSFYFPPEEQEEHATKRKASERPRRWERHDCVTFPWYDASPSSREDADTSLAYEKAFSTERSCELSDSAKSRRRSSLSSLQSSSSSHTLGEEEEEENALSSVSLSSEEKIISIDKKDTSSLSSSPSKKIVRMKIRSLKEKSCMRLLPSGGSWGLFGAGTIPPGVDTVVVTEGEFDAMSVYQATGLPAVSVPLGARSLPIQVLPFFEKFTKIILWLDEDAAGREGAELFASKLGIGRCYLVRSTLAYESLLREASSLSSLEKGGVSSPPPLDSDNTDAARIATLSMNSEKKKKKDGPNEAEKKKRTSNLVVGEEKEEEKNEKNRSEGEDEEREQDSVNSPDLSHLSSWSKTPTTEKETAITNDR